MKTNNHYSAFTFVELVAAIFILTIVIVPATKHLADSMTMRRELEVNRKMTILAVQAIEEQMTVVNNNFVFVNESGNFSLQGMPEFAYQHIRSDTYASGGIPDLLMTITVKIWHDKNNDLIQDAAEPLVELHTIMARSIVP